MAEYECSCTGGHTLVKIESEEENTFVNSLTGGEDVWIGLNDKAVEGTYVWSDGTALGSYEPWVSGQPDPANSDKQDCVKIKGTTADWNDVSCSGDSKGSHQSRKDKILLEIFISYHLV